MCTHFLPTMSSGWGSGVERCYLRSLDVDHAFSYNFCLFENRFAAFLVCRLLLSAYVPPCHSCRWCLTISPPFAVLYFFPDLSPLD